MKRYLLALGLMTTLPSFAQSVNRANLLGLLQRECVPLLLPQANRFHGLRLDKEA